METAILIKMKKIIQKCLAAIILSVLLPGINGQTIDPAWQKFENDRTDSCAAQLEGYLSG